MECFSKIRPQPYPTGGEEREYRDEGLVWTGLLKCVCICTVHYED